MIKVGVEMVIQSNMSPVALVDVWGDTAAVFEKYNVPLEKQSLDSLVGNELLLPLLQELNSVVGSSTVTCVKGG